MDTVQFRQLIAAIQTAAAEREATVQAALGRLDGVWKALFPDGQAQVMALMIEGVAVSGPGESR